MRLEFPTAHELRDGAVEYEGIEEVHMIDHEEAGALGIETGGYANFHAGAGEERYATAEGALQPVVLAHIQKNIEKNKNGCRDEEMQEAENREHGAAQHQEGTLHMCTSTAPGMMSSERHCRVAISPSSQRRAKARRRSCATRMKTPRR